MEVQSAVRRDNTPHSGLLRLEAYIEATYLETGRGPKVWAARFPQLKRQPLRTGMSEHALHPKRFKQAIRIADARKIGIIEFSVKIPAKSLSPS